MLEKVQTTPSNVPNTAMLTGIARMSVGTKPRQKTRPPDSAYILRAVRHDDVSKPASASAVLIVPACKRVLRTSKGNVAIQPRTPAAPPARRGAHRRREGASSTTPSSRTGSAAGRAGAKRRSVPSYWCFACMNEKELGSTGGAARTHAPHRSTARIRLRLARWLRRARDRVRGCRPRGRRVARRRVLMRGMRVLLLEWRSIAVVAAAFAAGS